MITKDLAIVRQRYQLTIPASLRKLLDWLEPQQVVKISAVDKEKVLVEPYRRKTTNWKNIYKNLDQIKEWAGKTSLSEFVIKDRGTH